MKILYIPYEISSRELIGLLHISEHLVNKGIVNRVYIGKSRTLRSAVRWNVLKPGGWLFKSAQRYVLPFALKLSKKKFTLFLQDIEALATFDDEREYDLFMKSCSTLRIMNTILCSTQNEERAIKEKNNCKTIISGPLRLYHYLDPRFIRLCQERKPKSKKTKILYVTSATSIHFHWLYSYQDMIKSLEKEGMNQENVRKIEKWAYDSHVDLLAFIGVISKIIKCNPNKYIITIRPHPSENSDLYTKLFAGIDNIEITRERPLALEIMDADKIFIGSCSTSIFETSLLKKRPSCLLVNSDSPFTAFYRKHILYKLTNNILSIEDAYKHVTDDNRNNMGEINKEHVTKHLNMNKHNFETALNCFEEIKPLPKNFANILWIKYFKYIYVLIDTLINVATHTYLNKSHRYTFYKSKVTDSDFIGGYSKTLKVKVKSYNNSLYEVYKND